MNKNHFKVHIYIYQEIKLTEQSLCKSKTWDRRNLVAYTIWKCPLETSSQ